MSLESGTYTIVSSLSKFPVGRPLLEDRSLLPKRVMTLDPGHNHETPTASHLHHPLTALFVF